LSRARRARGYTGNAGKAEVKGIEYDADLRLGKLHDHHQRLVQRRQAGRRLLQLPRGPAAAATIAPTALQTGAPGTYVDAEWQASCSTTRTRRHQPADADRVAGVQTGTRLPRQPEIKGTSRRLPLTTRISATTSAYFQAAAL